MDSAATAAGRDEPELHELLDEREDVSGDASRVGFCDVDDRTDDLPEVSRLLEEPPDSGCLAIEVVDVRADRIEDHELARKLLDEEVSTPPNDRLQVVHHQEGG